MVIIRPALRISGCVQGSSELSYRQVAARDYRVPEGIDRLRQPKQNLLRLRATVVIY
jgi:hypothetical protein